MAVVANEKMGRVETLAKWSIACLLLVWPLAAVADPAERKPSQADTLTAQILDLEATRSPAQLIEAPLSISVVSREEIVPARPTADLAEALELVPGVFAQTSGNYAQDTRVSIRGFGSRSTFGVRGIKVLVDGVPTTLPDGQSELDSIDLAFVDRVEVIRGPISSLYGGGSGGILSIRTVQPTEETTLEVRSTFVSDHFSRYEGLARGALNEIGYVLGLTYTRYSGYRDHARANQSVLLSKFQHEFPDGTELGLAFSSVWAPEAQDPGGLTRQQVREDRTAAHPANRIFDAGEKLDQQKIALTLRRPLWGGGELRFMGYWLDRDFSNKLPFTRQVDLDRNAGGGALLYTDRWRRLSWSAGLDVDVQDDRRENYENLGGARGPLILDQDETVTAIGPFAQAELDLGRGWAAVAGLRYDWTEFEVRDHFTPDGDQSDSIRFRQLSPRFSLRYSRSQRLSLYAGLSTGFQVPTTIELKPSNGGGFDSGREPERSLGIELGAKGLLGDRLLYEVALFQIRVRDVLVPFQDLAGDTFFRNAGEVRRRGAEVALSALLRPGLSFRASYTYADYRYTDYKPFDPVTGGIADFDGNREPNNPRHMVGAELRFTHPSGLFSVLSLRHFSDLEANDANTEESAGATISDVRVGYERWRGRLRIRPFMGLRNWTSVEYNGSIRPNATRGRYYEPAPEIQVYGGLEVVVRATP